jgi:predicted nucleotidyltransferase
VNVAAPALSPFFRSGLQAELLARLLLNPDRAYTAAELARVVGGAYATVHREVGRLAAAGLVRQEQVGRAIRLRANTTDPAYGPASQLLRLSYGPGVVVPRELAGLDGIDEAYIYGSWAARRAGEAGDSPGDVDVLVVGDPDRVALDEAAERAEAALGREVNVRLVSPQAWREADSLFIRTVRDRPLVQLDLVAEAGEAER